MAFIKCSECGSKFDSKNKYCPNCGNPIEDNNLENENICPNCGSPNKENAIFCEECGYSLNNFTNKNKEKKNKGVIVGVSISLVCLIILIIVLFGIFSFNNKVVKPDEPQKFDNNDNRENIDKNENKVEIKDNNEINNSKVKLEKKYEAEGDTYFILHSDNTFNGKRNFCAGFEDIKGTYKIYGNTLELEFNESMGDGRNIIDYLEIKSDKITYKKGDYYIVSCNGYDFYLSDDNSVDVITPTLIMNCSKDTERGYEENVFYFESDERGNTVPYKYEYKITTPDGFNPDDYLNDEIIMNQGRYRTSLEGRVVISYIDKTMPFWKDGDFRYKDMFFRYINKEFVEEGYNCK